MEIYICELRECVFPSEQEDLIGTLDPFTSIDGARMAALDASMNWTDLPVAAVQIHDGSITGNFNFSLLGAAYQGIWFVPERAHGEEKQQG